MKKILNSYSAKLICIFLIAALLTVTILLWVQNQSIYKQQQEEISAIRQALEQLEDYADNNEFDEDGKPYIHIELEQPKTNYENVGSLTDVLNIVQNQNAQTSRDLSSQITMFAIIISIVTLVIPVLNYTFLQKDQLRKIDNQYKGLNKKSIKQYKELKEKMKKSFNQYNELKEKMEKSIEQYKELKDKMEKSIEQSTEVTTAVANPESESLEIKPISDTKEDRARAYFLQASLLVRDNKLNMSLQYFNKAIELEPMNARYYYNRGVTLNNLERYEEALKDKNKAIQLEPEKAEYFNSRGTTLHNLKRYKESYNDVNKAIKLHASDKFKCAKGMTLVRLKRFKEAYDILSDVIGCEDTSYYYRYRGFAKLGLAQSKGEPVPALAWEDFDKAIELERQDYLNYKLKAEAYLMIGEPEQAKPLLDKAYELEPKEPETHHLLALYYEQIGKNQKAKEYHELADKYGYIPEPDIEDDKECD